MDDDGKSLETYSNERLTAEVRALRITLALLINELAGPKRGAGPDFFKSLADLQFDMTDETRRALRHMGHFSAEIEDILQRVRDRGNSGKR